MIGQSEFEKALFAESVKHLFRTARDILKWAGAEVKDAVLLERASSEYLNRYLQRHGLVKILGMAQSVPLREIYTDVQLLRPDELRAFDNLDELEKAFRQREQGEIGQHRTKMDGVSVANKEQFLNVLGQPGAGKSTFLRRIGLEALTGHAAGLLSDRRKISPYQFPSIPILIELKTLKAQQTDLIKLIEEEFAICGFPNSFVAAALKRGDLLILLDGLDEVPTDKLESSIREIRNFVDRYDKNRFLTSCRTAFYKNWLTRFTDVVIADFDNSQVERFIQNWFRSSIDLEQKTAEECWTLLSSAHHVATLELARTPLLLTFLCLVYNRTQGFPSNRSSLYRRALGILLEEWAAEKRITRPTIYQGLHSDLELMLLANIAGPSFIESKLFFSEAELLNVIGTFLQEELNAPKHIDSRSVLHAIEVEQGLLIKRPHGAYSFSHLTLHEFLAAHYINSEERSFEFVERSLTEPRWREVLLLLAGLGKADGLLQRMANEIVTMSHKSGAITAVLRWAADTVVELESGPKQASRRAILVLFRATFEMESLQRRSESSHTRTEEILDIIQSSGALCATLRIAALRLDASSEKAVSLSFVLAQRLQPMEIVNAALASRLDFQMSLSHILKVLRELGAEGVFADRIIQSAAQQLEKVISSVVELPSSREDKLALFERARLAILSALGVHDSRGIVGSLENLKLLEMIASGCQLIAECRGSALSVSATGWESAAKRLLTPPNA